MYPNYPQQPPQNPQSPYPQQYSYPQPSYPVGQQPYQQQPYPYQQYPYRQSPSPYQPPVVNEQARQALMREQYYKGKRKKEIADLLVEGLLFGGAILLYLIIETVIVLVLQLSKFQAVYNESALFQNCFNIVAVHLTSMFIPFSLVALILKKRYRVPIVPTKKLGVLKTVSWLSVGMGICMAANYVTNAVIALFKAGGYELSQPEMLEAKDVPTLIAELFAVAIVPAVFEEYAMRCCALGVLRNHGKAFGVIAVSIVFGLIHGNVIQFVFAFLIGLILGYITVATDSVIPAMLIHGFNNGLSVTSDILKNFLTEDVADYILSGIIIVWIVLAIVFLVRLIVKKELIVKSEKKEKEPYAPSFGLKLLCLLPGFFLPFLILIWMTTQYVTPIG